MNVSLWLKQSPLDHLDAELILAHVLGVERTNLHAHPERELAPSEQRRADALSERRLRHEPLAYLVGYKEFYGRTFTVTPNTLIPRPETEALVNCVISLKKTTPKPLKILDVGTGSGCIAITLAKELSDTVITGVDISEEALKIAKNNAKKLAANVDFHLSDLLDNTQKYDIIVANLPYVDKKWSWTSPELAYEPRMALYAPDGGLALIKKLIRQSPRHLCKNGFLILEADLSQHAAIIDYAQKYAFCAKTAKTASTDAFSDLCLCLQKTSSAPLDKS